MYDIIIYNEDTNKHFSPSLAHVTTELLTTDGNGYY